MRKGGTLIVIAAAILGLWATSAFACHIVATCTTATLVSDRWNDRVLVVRTSGYQHWQTLNGKELTVPNNGPHGHVSSAGFHNGREWRDVGAPYGCVRPTTTTTTVAPTTTTSTTEAPTSTTTVPPTTTTSPPSSSTSSTTIFANTSTSLPGSTTTSSVAPNPTTSTTLKRDIGGPPASVMSPPAPPTDELPRTGSNGLVPVAAVGAVILAAGLACVASKKKAQR